MGVEPTLEQEAARATVLKTAESLFQAAPDCPRIRLRADNRDVAAKSWRVWLSGLFGQSRRAEGDQHQLLEIARDRQQIFCQLVFADTYAAKEVLSKRSSLDARSTLAMVQAAPVEHRIEHVAGALGVMVGDTFRADPPPTYSFEFADTLGRAYSVRGFRDHTSVPAEQHQFNSSVWLDAYVFDGNTCMLVLAVHRRD
jgi:hypothetical protein